MFDFILRVGPLVWGIIGLSTIMWWLIVRSYANQNHSRQQFDHALSQYKQCAANLSNKAYQQVCTTWLSQAEQQLNQGLAWISVMVKILPLLGLLGTVDGMIESFRQLDQLDIQRQLSGGISQALLTTLCGLVTALSGLYFVHNLNQRKLRHLAQLRAQLEVNHALSS